MGDSSGHWSTRSEQFKKIESRLTAKSSALLFLSMPSPRSPASRLSPPPPPFRRRSREASASSPQDRSRSPAPFRRRSRDSSSSSPHDRRSSSPHDRRSRPTVHRSSRSRSRRSRRRPSRLVHNNRCPRRPASWVAPPGYKHSTWVPPPPVRRHFPLDNSEPLSRRFNDLSLGPSINSHGLRRGGATIKAGW
jgi:hypothetical protein